ncbi:MAG TPA: cell division protein CrgA [Mycobacteriales bacterium]
MPKSKVRKRAVYTPPADVLPSPARATRKKGPSPTWYPVTMLALMVIGLAYIATFYLAGEKIPVMRDLNSWNFAIGFGLMVTGLFMAVRWR